MDGGESVYPRLFMAHRFHFPVNCSMFLSLKTSGDFGKARSIAVIGKCGPKSLLVTVLRRQGQSLLPNASIPGGKREQSQLFEMANRFPRVASNIKESWHY